MIIFNAHCHLVVAVTFVYPAALSNKDRCLNILLCHTLALSFCGRADTIILYVYMSGVF